MCFEFTSPKKYYYRDGWEEYIAYVDFTRKVFREEKDR